MANSDVTVYLNGDISGLRKATRDASKEIAKVGKAADKASADAANGSTKAFAGLTRIIATGKVSAKSLEKVGKSASSAINAASGFVGIGAALGLVALPGLAQGATMLIDGIAASTKSVATEANEAAAALRSYTVAQLAAGGAADAVTLAQMNLRTATRDLDKVRADGTASADDRSRAEIGVRNATRDVELAQIASKDAHKKAADEQKKFVEQLDQTLEKSKDLAPAFAAANGGFINQAAYVGAASKSLRDLAASSDTMTDSEKAATLKLADFIDKTGQVPDDIKTLIKTPGLIAALADVTAYTGKLNSIPRRILTILATRHDKPSGTGLATGGRIAGSPNSRDDVNVNVSQGEVILNPRQQAMVNAGATIDEALAGAPIVRAGGGFASGGKAADRLQARLDRDKDRFGFTMSGDDLLLARAEATPAFTDDARVLGGERSHILSRIAQIKRSRRLKHLTRQQKQDLNDEESSLLRQLAGISQSLRDGAAAGAGDVFGGAAAEPDPFALDRARTEGFSAGLGKAEGYVFGGLSDIGSGPGTIPALHVESLTFTNSVQNQGQIAQAGNRGNDTLSGGRIRATRTGLVF